MCAETLPETREEEGTWRSGLALPGLLCVGAGVLPAGGEGARADALPWDGGPTPVLGYTAGPIGVLGVVPDIHRASGAALPC